jgi:hypothetical protein
MSAAAASDDQVERKALTEEEVASLSALAADNQRILLANTANVDVNSDGNAWTFDFEKPELGLKVYYSSAEGSSLVRYMAVIALPGITPFSLVRV